ncbi:MAG TPA: hypothetical protein VGH77_09020 [Streptosporangiaceae bacterium]
MSIPTETIESWLHQLLHPDRIPREALAGGMTSETAWEHWAEDRAREAKGLPKVDQHLSSAERWWYQRFDPRPPPGTRCRPQQGHVRRRRAAPVRTRPATGGRVMAGPSDAELRQIKAFQRALRTDGWLPVPGGWTHPDIPGMVFSDPDRPGLCSETG